MAGAGATAGVTQPMSLTQVMVVTAVTAVKVAQAC
ncbi:Uncharacterised protein [Cedecea neteri]|uniref:Uncharacterized protein n=1 Tax=Cedecea neteri TaxID=158822 RepID=A0A2X2TC80_9ENTR|nr:Uncharacterised protein [Cedecea neteri]